MNKRMGKFYLHKNMLEDEPAIAKAIFKQLEFIPYRVEYLGYRDAYEYVGVSVKFEVTAQFIKLPEYSVIPILTGGKVTGIKVEKVVRGNYE